MPAPRLLPKKLVNAELATERKNEIEKGVKLAKAVEALQEAKEKEERELEEFRRETIARVQIQIDAKIRESELLSRDIVRLKDERMLAQAPINLREEWQKVREDKIANASWQERNTNDSLEILSDAEENRVLSRELDEERELIRGEHELSLRTLKGSESKLTQSNDALERAEHQAQAILHDAQERDNHLRVREEDATVREVSLSKREEQTQAHEIDLSNREIKLKNRQETFLRAQRYIKSKKQ